jgi:hypothetical protein
MRNLYLNNSWLYLMLFTSFLGFGNQNDIFSQTTQEEYLYVTFGYKEQLQKGLDDKKGYSWKPLMQHQFSYKKNGFLNAQFQTGVFDFEALYRDTVARPCAFGIIFRERQGIAKKDGVFVCIPHPLSDKDIHLKAEKYVLEEAKFSESVFQQYAVALGKLAIKLSTL